MLSSFDRGCSANRRFFCMEASHHTRQTTVLASLATAVAFVANRAPRAHFGRPRPIAHGEIPPRCADGPRLGARSLAFAVQRRHQRLPLLICQLVSAHHVDQYTLRSTGLHTRPRMGEGWAGARPNITIASTRMEAKAELIKWVTSSASRIQADRPVFRVRRYATASLSSRAMATQRRTRLGSRPMV